MSALVSHYPLSCKFQKHHKANSELIITTAQKPFFGYSASRTTGGLVGTEPTEGRGFKGTDAIPFTYGALPYCCQQYQAMWPYFPHL